MKRVIGRAGRLVILAPGLSAVAASAQDRLGAAPVAPKLRFSLEGATGLQVYYHGSMQSISFGFAPTRSLTLLVSAERSYVADKIEFYEDGFGSERGIQVLYYGGGVRIPVRPRLDAFVDARLIMAVEARSDYFGVRFRRVLASPGASERLRRS